MPKVARRVAFDTEDHEVTQGEERVMKSEGPASEALTPLRHEGIDTRPVDHEKVAMLAFFEELITVRIGTTTNPQDENIFEVIINGESEVFRRGEEKTVKRKFVDRLARTKITTYTQEKRRDNNNAEYYVQIPHTGVRYPFSVVRDDHPRGADWLKNVLLEPA